MLIDRGKITLKTNIQLFMQSTGISIPTTIESFVWLQTSKPFTVTDKSKFVRFVK